MGHLFIIACIILLVIAVIGIPMLISVLLYRFFKKKEGLRKYRLLAFTPVIVVACIIYTAIYPLDGFYEQDYTEATKRAFPESAEIHAKSASYPDHFGDYTSVALIELDEKTFDALSKELPEEGFKNATDKPGCSELTYVEKTLKGRTYVRELEKYSEGGRYYFIGFLSDKKSIVVIRASS